MDLSKTKLLDLRFLIGILFTIYGVILVIYGAIADPHTKALSWNIDLWWGLVNLIIGLVFLWIARRPQRLDD